jgi:hypothetical protein
MDSIRPEIFDAILSEVQIACNGWRLLGPIHYGYISDSRSELTPDFRIS